MKLYGIFDKLDNYRLLRYSMAPLEDNIVNMAIPATRTYKTVHEVCLPDIEYSSENIGKIYNIQTQTFEN